MPTDDGRVVALRVENGEPVWERRLGGAPNDILALDDRALRRLEGQLLLLPDGARRRASTGAGGPAPMSSASRSPTTGTSISSSLDNVLRALNRGSGVQQWMRPLPLRPASGAAQAASTVVVAGIAPRCAPINVKDGAPAGELPGRPATRRAPPHAFTDADRAAAWSLVGHASTSRRVRPSPRRQRAPSNRRRCARRAAAERRSSAIAPTA